MTTISRRKLIQVSGKWLFVIGVAAFAYFIAESPTGRTTAPVLLVFLAVLLLLSFFGPLMQKYVLVPIKRALESLPPKIYCGIVAIQDVAVIGAFLGIGYFIHGQWETNKYEIIGALIVGAFGVLRDSYVEAMRENNANK